MHLWDMLNNETYNNSPRNGDDMKASPPEHNVFCLQRVYEIRRVSANQRKPFFKFGGYRPNINCSTLNYTR